MDANERQDVRMAQRLPEDSFFAKLLEKGGQNHIPGSRKNIVDARLSYLPEVILLCNSQGLDRDEMPHVCSGPDICKSTGGEYLV